MRRTSMVGLSLTVGLAVMIRLPVPSGAADSSGWKTVDPAAAGFSTARLAVADEHIRRDLPNFRSVVLVRKGRIAYERYYHGARAEPPQPVASVTKAVVSALIGIAVRDRLLREDEPLRTFFPTLRTAGDRSRGEIKVRDLLTMTSGLSLDLRTAIVEMEPSPNWTEFILKRPMTNPPGKRFEYGGASHLLTSILRGRVKGSLREYADRVLFKPARMQPGVWPRDPQGIEYGTHGLTLTTRDMARFGQLYLNGGKSGGRQIVPVAWVRRSTAQHNPGGPPENSGYGYLWWVSRETGYPAYFAAGYGGQFIYVIPKLELVVAMTGDVNLFPDRIRDHRHLVRDHLVPALKN